MITELLEQLFPWKATKSKDDAKRRLKLIIAHDRIGLSPEKVQAMRQEILEVVARYVEIDPDDMQLAIESSQRITTLVANLPIKRVIEETKAPEGGVKPKTQIVDESNASSQESDINLNIDSFDEDNQEKIPNLTKDDIISFENLDDDP